MAPAATEVPPQISATAWETAEDTAVAASSRAWELACDTELDRPEKYYCCHFVIQSIT